MDVPTVDNAEVVFSMEDVHLALLYDLDELSKKVDEVWRQAENQRSESVGAFAKRTERQKETFEAALAHFKKRNIDGLCTSVENICHIVEPNYPGSFELELQNKMTEIVENDEHLLRAVESQLISTKKRVETLERIHHDLQKMTAKRMEKGDLMVNTDWKSALEKSRKKRLAIIQHLRFIESQLFQDSELSSILGAASEASKTDDPYIKIEVKWQREVEFLLRCNILTRHPYDNTRVRIVNVI